MTVFMYLRNERTLYFAFAYISVNSIYAKTVFISTESVHPCQSLGKSFTISGKKSIPNLFWASIF